MRIKNFAIAVLAGIALALATISIMRMSVPNEPKTALVIPSPTALPEVALVDHLGDPVDANTFRGQWDLVFFGFTHCPDVCPTTLQTLANAQQTLIESGTDSIPRIVLVSVDPERDTPDILKKYINYFGPGHLGITAELEQLRIFTSALGIYFEKVAADHGDYSVDHSAAVLVINPDGEFSALFSTPHNAESFVYDLPIIMSLQ